MKTPQLRLATYFLIVFLFLFVSACNLPAASTPDAQDPGAIYTQAAQTVMAQLTQVAGGITPLPPSATPNGSQGEPTSGANPTDTPLPSPTQAPPPTATPQPTATTAPTATSKPTATPLPCNLAQFVKDVSVPDGTEFLPGTSFTKTWRLKNIGSCTWTTRYSLVFFKGDDMGGDTTPLPHSVDPGETIDLSVDLVAPSDPGTYKGNWMLRDSSGRFGIGDNGDKPFFVEIEVTEPDSGLVYSFAANYCQADWESGAGDLSCPGESDDADGFVIRLTNPDLESRHENELALWTNPEMVKDGWISGTFPAFKVQDGDHFIADVGCLANNTKCDVTFQLNYQISGPSVTTLKEVHEVYDGQTTRIDVDLSSLAGKNVKFILTVLANGDYKGDAAFWLVPQINR